MTITNRSLIIDQLGAYGYCSIEGLISYCLQQNTTTREAAIEAIYLVGSMNRATIEDGTLSVEGLGGC